MTSFVSAADLRGMLGDGGELALIDVREELIFSQNHLLLARSVPLSRFELRFAPLVPRRATRIVLCDDDDGLAERAAAILTRNGYANVRILGGGVAAWDAAGFELFSGVNVPSKAFGEYIEHANGTPSIAAGELEKLLRDGADLVVLDSRPFDEYARVSIPTATNVPGAELVLRARDLAPSPETMVVVNCAGRTRSIIGAQSLINAGLPNKVVALRNGTMGWSLAGFACDSGKNRRAPDVSAKMLDWARARGASAWRKAAASSASIGPTLDAWRKDDERTLYIFDVRDPAEYASRPCARRDLGARRPAGAGDRSICRHARRAHRARRRRRSPRRDDGVLAAPNGFCRCLRAGRGGNRDRLARSAAARSRDASRRRHRQCRAQRTSGPQRGDRRRSFAEPQLHRAPYSGRLVRDPDAA